jgi:glutaredoxin 3
MPKIEIYTKYLCPYCARAKALLQGKGAAFEDIDITSDAERRAEMIARSGGGLTVPQIFIDGRHIGGSDDLAAADDNGQLDTMLGH